MDSLFLRNLPVLSLADDESKVFITDFPEPRPAFEHAQIWAKEWRAHMIEKVAEVMKHKNCAVTYTQFVVDQHGFLGIVCFNHPIPIGNATSAAKRGFSNASPT